MAKNGGPSDQLGFLYPISGAKASGEGTTRSQSHSEDNCRTNHQNVDALRREQESIAFLMEQLSKSGILDTKKRS